ncbi:MAG: tRNA lysidine(34) synthetase TilS [Acidobacteriota bacterium]
MAKPADHLAELENRFSEALTHQCHVRPGHRVVVAVSGGADSLCLLRLLLNFQGLHGYPDLHVAHLDHSVRGEESRRVAVAMRRLSRRRGVPCTLEALPAWNGSPSEDDLRQVRHAYLERVADATGSQWIALAHHRRDQAETVLWNLARGSGRRGLGAMRYVVGRRIRPLLETSPLDLRKYLRGCRQRWYEDDSNRLPIYTRNRVRALVPLLERRIHAGAERNLARAATILGAEDELLDSLAERRLKELMLHQGAFLALDAGALRTDHPALRWRVLRGAVRVLSDGSFSLTLARTERLAKLALGAGGSIDLGGGYRAERLKRLLILRRPRPPAERSPGPVPAVRPSRARRGAQRDLT